MKKNKTIFITACLTLYAAMAIGQTKFNPQKAGNVFYMAVPDYMSKTIGLNDVATVQYKNSIKDIYTIVIEDNKEDLKLAEINYASLSEFQEEFAKDFIKDEGKRPSSKPIFTTKNDINFVEYDTAYFDKETNREIYYLVGIVETKSHFYKILSWTSMDNKDKYKADFQKMLYSLKQ